METYGLTCAQPDTSPALGCHPRVYRAYNAGYTNEVLIAITGSRHLTREVAIPDFPTSGKTTTMNWREAEQNFGLKDVR